MLRHRLTEQHSRWLENGNRHISRIVHKDLGLKCLKKRRAQELSAANLLMRLVRSRQLLRRFPDNTADFIFFTDEQVSRSRHPSTYRMISSMHWLVQRNTRLPLNASCVRDQPSESSSWSLRLPPSCVVRVSCSSSQVSKWTGSITGTYSCPRTSASHLSYRRRYVRLSARQRTDASCKWDDRTSASRASWFHQTTSMATKQSGFEPGYLQHPGSDAGASVSNAETRRSRIEAASDRHLVRAAAERYWRRGWTIQKSVQSLCSS